MIDLYTPSGIGDIYWILQKLARTANAAGEKFRIHTPPGGDARFSRGKFLEFLDCVESVTPDGVPFVQLQKRARQYSKLEKVMTCEANTWLESGQRLEKYMPAFPTEYVLNWQITDDDKARARAMLDPTRKNIVVYTSSIENNESKSTGPWSARDWRARLEAVRAIPDVNLIWIGAAYDADILGALMPQSLFDAVQINTPAPVVVSLLRGCDGFISYQSGLSCISVVEQVPTLMLYFRKIAALTKTFNPPGGNYCPVFFDTRPNFVGWVSSLPTRGGGV